jgi:hypothetical protein
MAQLHKVASGTLTLAKPPQNSGQPHHSMILSIQTPSTNRFASWRPPPFYNRLPSNQQSPAPESFNVKNPQLLRRWIQFSRPMHPGANQLPILKQNQKTRWTEFLVPHSPQWRLKLNSKSGVDPGQCSTPMSRLPTLQSNPEG